MGHGVVGSGVAEILTTHKQKLFSSVGEEISLKYILDLREFPESPLCDRFTKDFEVIVNDKEVRVVIETMGGLNPAYEFTKRCLSLGKSVVTSKKELVARHGAELLKIAKENNANYLFEASVGGGIPILRPIDQCLVANNVDEIAGILNGTTNFILTKMINENMAFDKAQNILVPFRTWRNSITGKAAAELTPAARFVFWLLLHSASTFIPTTYIPRALQKSPLRTLSMQPPGAV